MPVLRPLNHRSMTEASAYYQFGRLSARLVRIGHFQGRELYHAMQRPSVKFLAEAAVEKFFHRDDGLKVRRDMRVLYQALLVMLPILSRIPGSLHPEQHRGHVLSWLRVYVGGNAKRRFLSCREIPRVHNPALLQKRLEALGIHDRTFVRILTALFRGYYWRDTASGKLARVLFDPIMMETERDRHSLRIGNRIYHLHKLRGHKTLDLNRSPLTLFDYLVRYDSAPSRNKVTISLSPAAVASFKREVRRILKPETSVDYKMGRIRDEIDKFVERAKWAKDGRSEIIELRGWLWRSMQPLVTPEAEKAPPVKKKKRRKTPEQVAAQKAVRAAVLAKKEEADHLANTLLNRWLQKRETGLIRGRRNVFYILDKVELRVFFNFLSPYREEG